MFHGCVCVSRGGVDFFFFSGEGVCVCVCVRALGGEMRCVLETYGSEVEVVLLLLNSRIGWQM